MFCIWWTWPSEIWFPCNPCKWTFLFLSRMLPSIFLCRFSVLGFLEISSLPYLMLFPPILSPSTQALCLLFIRPAFYCGLLGICTAITIFLLLPSPLLFIKHFLYVWNFSKSFTCTASFTPNCFWNACGHSHNCSHFLKEKTKFRQTVKFTWHKFIWLENGELGP